MRIALFIPCFNDAFFPGTGVATVRILERLGHEVSFPRDQTCCGQVHFNTGYRQEARHLLRRFVRVFRLTEAEAVVAPSASCVAMVREHYGELLGEADGEGLADEVRGLAGRVFELSEFLVNELGVESVGARFPGTVVFHPTCHSIRGIDVGDAPLRLLRNVEGIDLVDLPNSLECCGFGGTFSVKNPHTSLAMLADKIRDIRESGAEVLTAVDNSCLMHIAGGLHREGLLEPSGHGNDLGRIPPGRSPQPPASGGIRVKHLAEILACTGGRAS